MRENAALYTDDRALAQAAGNGNPDASAALVRRYQDEAVRAAYLLTGHQQRATELAATAFLDVFGRMRRSDPDREFRPWLLGCLATRFLAPASSSDDQISRPDPLSPDTDVRQRYAVENERVRLAVALARLDARPRVVLVLHEFSNISVDAIARMLDADPGTIREVAASAGKRLRVAAGLDEEQPLPAALRQAAVNVPRLDLWEHIAGPLVDLYEQERRRSRMINLGAFVAVCLGLGLAGLLLFGDAFGSGDGESSRAEAGVDETPLPVTATTTTGRTSESAAFAARRAVPSPGPGAADESVGPRASVPGTVLFSRSSGGTVIYQPGAPANVRQVPRPASGDVREAAPPAISPDGRRIVMLYYVFTSDRVSGIVAGYESGLEQVRWSAELTSAEYSGDGRAPFFLTARTDGQRVYVAVHYWRSSRPVSIVVLDLESGDERETIETTVPGFVAHDVRLYAPPGHDTVYFFTISQDEPTRSGQMQILFLAYRIPGGEQIHGRLLTDLTDSRAFFVYGSRFTPDGNGLYNLAYIGQQSELAVHFFDLKRGAIARPVLLPFQPLVQPVPYQQAVSHDGGTLFVLSPATREVAIVDLVDRELDGIVPLDMGDLNAAPVDPAHFSRGTAKLSPDGTRLYAIGATNGATTPQPSGIWVIDTATWTVTDHWLPDAVPDTLLLDADGETLYFRETHQATLAARTDTLRAIDTRTGSEKSVEVPILGNFSMYSLASLYRDRYGSTPSTGGRTPGRVPQARPLAGMAVSVSPEAIQPGDQVIVDVRFIHPLTGEMITDDTSKVRYTPPATVRATFTPEDGAPVILDLGLASYGRYQGTVALSAAGSWSVRVVAGWSDSQRADLITVVNGAVETRPAAPLASEVGNGFFAGPDGRTYAVRVSTIPSPPTAGRLVEMRAWFVDAETGARLPWEVWLEGGLPHEMTVTLVMPEHGDEVAFTLSRFGQGYFSGNVAFPNAGAAVPRVTLPSSAAGAQSVAAGEITVLAPE